MSGKPPLVIDRDVYEQLLKDPLYGRLTKIGIEIGRIIVKEGGNTCHTVTA